MPAFVLNNFAGIVNHPEGTTVIQQAGLHGIWYYRVKHIETNMFVTPWIEFPVGGGEVTPPIKMPKESKLPFYFKTETEMKKELKDIKIRDLYTYKNLSKYTGLEGKIPVRADTTYVGVEIELENVSYDITPVGTWNLVEDGSLKIKGQEFVSVPIQFRYLEVELERLFKTLKTKNASSRCSVHVHLNARDFNLEELKSFIALYMIFEKSLYNFSGDRWNNNFCVPVHFSPHYARALVRHMDINQCLWEGWQKYFGFNLCPLYGGESKKIGTIEFRHMKGTTNVDWIIKWINLIVSLKITAKKIPFTTIIEHLETMNTTSAYYWLAEETFKDHHEVITSQPTFKQDVERCITQAKTVFLSVKPPVAENKPEVVPF